MIPVLVVWAGVLMGLLPPEVDALVPGWIETLSRLVMDPLSSSAGTPLSKWAKKRCSSGPQARTLALEKHKKGLNKLTHIFNKKLKIPRISANKSCNQHTNMLNYWHAWIIDLSTRVFKILYLKNQNFQRFPSCFGFLQVELFFYKWVWPLRPFMWLPSKYNQI